MSIPQSGGGPIESFDQLAGLLEQGCKPKVDWRIGTEHEKFGWLTDRRAPLPYAGDRSIAAMFAGLESRFGWQAVREGEHVIGLTRNGANVSLEPGGQFELSGAPLESIHETAAELDNHLAEVAEVAGLAAFMGHLFPVWLGFRGGKGVATFLGLMLALDWRVGLACCATWAVGAVISRISSVGALLAAAVCPVWLFTFDHGRMLLLVLVLTVLIYVRHSANLLRIKAGTEPKIGRRKTGPS